MRRNNPALNLFVVILTLGLPAIALAQQPRVIEIVEKDKDSKVLTITMDDENLLLEPIEGSQVVLFTTEAFFDINHKNKTYRKYSHDEMRTSLARMHDELVEAQRNGSVGSSTSIKLTEETDTIFGSKARKFIAMNEGKIQSEFWMSSDLMPVKLRAISEGMFNMFPKGYSRGVNGGLGLFEMIVLYGIPVKIVINDNVQKIYHAQAGKSPNPSLSFQVPSDYKKLTN